MEHGTALSLFLCRMHRNLYGAPWRVRETGTKEHSYPFNRYVLHYCTDLLLD